MKRTGLSRLVLVVSSAALVGCSGVCAQEAGPGSPVQQAEQQFVPKDQSGIAPVHEEHERVAFVMPAFGVTNRQDAPRMSARQKFRLAARQAFDPFVFASSGIEAGMSQANDEFPEYGQGVGGFGKRYGAAMLDATSGGFASMSLCALLKQDPRYFRRGKGSIGSRIAYSMGQQFSAKSDRGNRQFNWSNIGGLLASASLANAYYPAPNRGFGLTMNRFAVSLAWGFTGELGDEFWPDVRHKFFHRRHRPGSGRGVSQGAGEL